MEMEMEKATATDYAIKEAEYPDNEAVGEP
jgi:hypothetical protein